MSNAMHVFKVEDGATHWVVARQPAHAIRLVAESFGFKDIGEYIRDQEPDTKRLERYETVEVRLDVDVPRDLYEHELEGLPKGTDVACSVVAHVRAGDMADLGEPGVFCSSEY